MVKVVERECPCGIARVDCEYHRPEPEPVHDDDWCDAVSYSMVGISDMHRIGQSVVHIASDCGKYVLTYQDGKLVDEEPSEAYTYTTTGVSLMHCGGGGGVTTNSPTTVGHGGSGAAPDGWLPRAIEWHIDSRLRGFKVPV